jgi:hypothetical protein
MAILPPEPTKTNGYRQRAIGNNEIIKLHKDIPGAEEGQATAKEYGDRNKGKLIEEFNTNARTKWQEREDLKASEKKSSDSRVRPQDDHRHIRDDPNRSHGRR